MKINTFMAVAVVFMSLSVLPAFAAEDSVTVEPKIESPSKGNYDNWAKDPIGALESKKAEVQILLKEGKITKDNADKMTKRIDAKIAEIKEFNKLTLQQKKDRLIKDCKNRLDLLVKDGKIDRKKADGILKSYTEKIRQWDGTGYPKYFEKCMKGKKH